MHEGSAASAAGPLFFFTRLFRGCVSGIERVHFFWEVSAGQNAGKYAAAGEALCTAPLSSRSCAATNPLFNDRKLKLGTFCTNLNGGCAISTIPETLKITWPNTVRLAQIADSMEFEALVPVGRWRGFGGV